ncbi:MAG TPA: type II toxin-antitoxin system PemK/MazF family toxin [Verrucomicrobiae bacterium]|nr:type II toxin-antitoxin system PemK/MazF family toxin [Verrucomicrobiae bacterium]
MTDPAPTRADVWLVRLDTVRPAVVLTRDPMGRLLHSVTLAPITSTVRGPSTEVQVGAENGVPLAQVVNLDTLQLIARSRLGRRVGRARPSTMRSTGTAASIAVGCDH